MLTGTSLEPDSIEKLVSPPLLEALRTSYQKKRLQFLIGAGSSIAAGLPGWGALNRRLIRKFFEEEPLANCLTNLLGDTFDRDTLFRDRIQYEPDELDSLASAFERFFGRDSVIDLLREQLHQAADLCGVNREVFFLTHLHSALYSKVEHYDLQPLHYELAAATLYREDDPRVIYTANYDDILEHALRTLANATGNVQDARKVAPLTDGGLKDLAVVHLHGYLPRNREDAEGRLILSEKDYLSSSGEWADRKLEDLLSNAGTDLLLIGLSLTDPRLRRLLHKRAELKRDHPDQVGEVYVFLSRGKDLDAPDLATRRAKRITAAYSEPYWESWGIRVINIANNELIPALLRQIRLGEDTGSWAAKGFEFLNDQDCYNELHSEKRQSQSQVYLLRQHAFIQDKFEVPTDEQFNLNVFVPSKNSPKSLELAFQFAGDFRRHRLDAKWVRLELDEIKVPWQLVAAYYHISEDCLHVQVMDQEHATDRHLDVSSWQNVQGASGFAFLSGTLMDVRNESKWFYHQFEPDILEQWDRERVYSSMLSVPVYDSPKWIPIGVASITSIRKTPFWAYLSTDELLNLAELLRSSFRNLLKYSSSFAD